MTRLLASVKSLTEAHLALACGADIIDLKNPETGVLGALPLDTVARVVQMVDRRSMVSATLGDLPMQPQILSEAAARMAATGVDFIKVGFFNAEKTCIAALAGKARLIAVLFADRGYDFSLLADFADAGFVGVMLDTADKTNGGLRSQMDAGTLQKFVERARSLGLVTGLAGSLRLEDVPDLIKLGPDYLGFRGALCAGTERNRNLDSSRLSALQNAIQCLSEETIRAAS
ncbi:MAG TPA: (5-formylfuran-3-yl)methyl phosphate synthase [Burkholderiales bacterium]|nr:(5-formylfuran-3-yl)methyl phosphate synthase [Burkholderiales bacterium]